MALLPMALNHGGTLSLRDRFGGTSMQAMGLEVWGFGLGLLGFRVQGLRGLGLNVSGFGLLGSPIGFRGFGFRGSAFRGLGFKDLDFSALTLGHAWARSSGTTTHMWRKHQHESLRDSFCSSWFTAAAAGLSPFAKSTHLPL